MPTPDNAARPQRRRRRHLQTTAPRADAVGVVAADSHPADSGDDGHAKRSYLQLVRPGRISAQRQGHEILSFVAFEPRAFDRSSGETWEMEGTPQKKAPSRLYCKSDVRQHQQAAAKSYPCLPPPPKYLRKRRTRARPR